MKTTIHQNLFAALLTPAVLLALGACDQTGNRAETRKAREATITASAAAELKDASARAGAVTGKGVGAGGDIAAKVVEQPGADDALIAAKVTTGLAADKNLSALKIAVDARDGVVTLRGPAPSAAARARAEEIARNVQGVTSVNNQLNVQAG